METWAQLLNCQPETESVAEGSISAQMRAFKDTAVFSYVFTYRQTVV